MKILDLFNSFNQIDKQIESMNSFFNSLFNDFMQIDYSYKFPTNEIQSDINTKKDGWEIQLSLPGYKKEDLKISLDENILEVSSEIKDVNCSQNVQTSIFKNVKSFYKSYQLPSNADLDKIEANLENGILRIFIPRIDAGKNKKIIEIK